MIIGFLALGFPGLGFREGLGFCIAIFRAPQGGVIGGIQGYIARY